MAPALCTWSPASLLIFSSNVYAPLIYYSHVTSFIVSLLIGFLVLWSNPRALVNRVLFAMTVFFSAWVFFDMVIWASEKPSFVMFFWASIVPVELSIYAAGLYLVSIFANHGQDVSLKRKLIIAAFFIPIFLLAHTSYNLLGFDYSNCDRNAIEGPLIQYMYIIELFFIGWAASIASRAYQKITDVKERQQMLLVSSGTILMLMLFTSGNLIVTYFLSVDWSYDQYKLMGMPLFVAFIAYSMVKFKTFNSKMIAAQALVAGIAISVLSLLFIREIIHVRIIAGIIFVLICILGYRLTRSVQREIKQREELEVANKWKESIIHAMNHQIKGYLGVARDIFSELLGTDYGQMPEQSKPLVTHGFEEMGKGVVYVQGILKSMSAQSGMLSYDKKQVDLRSLISNLASEQKDIAEQAGLSFSSTIVDGDYTINGDAAMLEEAFKNLITNAILYNNPHGSIAVTLSRTGQKTLLAVKDTGVGISKDDQKRLFMPGGMGKDSVKHNANASGYGLALVEPVIKEHQGKIWYETEVGKGTTFFVELPITQSGISGQTVAS